MQLVARAVGHRYGALEVLDGIDLEVCEGETLALIGPSGCGKSTLLGILGGMIEPTAGKIEMRGEPPPGCLNPLTYVFQDFALLPWRSVADNVALGLEHHPIPRREREERIAAVLSLTGLADFANAYPKQLSGGMRQRVGIARAIAVRPAVLLMDEPLSALDAQTRELLQEELVAIWAREKTTTVYVTHNLTEALHLADRVAVLSRRPGRLKQVIDIPIPRDERSLPAHAARLAGLQAALWDQIRSEAAAADREVADVG